MSPEEREYKKLMRDCMKLRRKLDSMLTNLGNDNVRLNELIKLLEQDYTNNSLKKSIIRLLNKYKN